MKKKVTPSVEMGPVKKAQPVEERVVEAIDEVSSRKEQSLSDIVGLPEPEKPDLLRSVEIPHTQSFEEQRKANANSLVHPENEIKAQPQIIEEEEVQNVNEIIVEENHEIEVASFDFPNKSKSEWDSDE